MRKSVRFFLFILDEILVIVGIFLVLYYFDVSFEIFLVFFLLFLFILGFTSYVFLPQLKQPATGVEGLIGLKAVALDSFDHQGLVFVRGEQWRAVTTERSVKKDEIVLITKVDGLTLTVEKIR